MGIKNGLLPNITKQVGEALTCLTYRKHRPVDVDCMREPLASGNEGK
jgi:hypothetical protein